jgi:phosphoserine phosphatase RsbU/P
MSSSMELKQIDGPPLPAIQWRLSNPFRIGRAASNELELPDPGVSRRHAAIERDGDGWLVRDCGARRGIRLNEIALQESAVAALQPGDVLGVGPWRFRVDVSAQEPSPAGASSPDTRISVVRAVGNLAEQRLELLLRYAGEIALATDESMLAEIMAEHALLGSGYGRSTVLWRTGDEVVVRCQRPSADPARPWSFNASLLRSAGSGEVAHFTADALEGSARSHEGRDRGRALCAPLMLDGTVLAYLYLDAERAGTRRHADAPTFCHALARLAGLALANLRRLESAREHAAVSADLDRAREVQHRLLPVAAGQIGAMRHALRLHPGRVVAGDVVDVFEAGEGRVVAALGDVSGAGLGAGLVMASVQSFLRAAFAHDADPARVIGLLNAHLCAQADGGRFVTLWLGVFNGDGSHCRFVDAGHGHALRIAAGTATALPSTGCIPLGIDAQAQFAAETLDLAAGEILLLYSDGIVEQRGAGGSAWGAQGLVDAVVGAASPADAIDRAWQAMGEHAAGNGPEDDSTVLALARR